MSRRLLLVAVDFLELGVDDVFRAVGLGAGFGPGLLAPLGVLGVVHRLAQLHGGLDHRLGLGADHLGVAAVDHALQVVQRALDRVAVGLADLVAVLLERLLGGVDDRVGLVLSLDARLALLVLGL